MAHRVFRLSISPEDVPEVRRVFDLDGRSSLADLHREIRQGYGLNAGNPLYAFFMSGRFWDAKSAYLDPRADGERADKALLFRLGLTPHKTFAYLLDFGAEQHFVVTVQEVRDSAQPLTAPQLVEAVGEPQFADTAESEQPEPPELTELVPLAEAFLDADDDLDEFEAQLSAARTAAEPWEDEDQVSEPRDSAALLDLSAAVPSLRAVAAAAEALVQALQGSLQRFLQLDEWLLSRSLGTRLLDLPSTLALAGEFEPALALTRALQFVDRELMQGDQAIILARAGRGAEALALVEQNLAQAQDAALVDLKAGDTHRALGDLAAAEAYYRRSLELAQSPAARYDARLRLVTCLVQSGRDAEAQQLLQQAQQAVGNSRVTTDVGSAGRNDPCPCGSGKKYKKCHGQN